MRAPCSLPAAGSGPRSDAIYPDGPSDVLELLLADVFEGEIETARRVLLDAGRHADAARLGQAFEARCDIDPVAEDVAVLDDDIALVDTDAELDAAVWRQRGVAFGQGCLHFGRASESVNDAGKLDQQPVAGGLDDAAPVNRYLWIDDFGAQRLEP